MHKVFAFSRLDDQPKQYVQDKLREEKERVAALLRSDKAYIYICGKKEMEQGVEEALADIARGESLEWKTVRDRMREEGRYHVETY
jgi:benzoyl-CoA 2,3-dioxygenase component A